MINSSAPLNVHLTHNRWPSSIYLSGGTLSDLQTLIIHVFVVVSMRERKELQSIFCLSGQISLLKMGLYLKFPFIQRLGIVYLLLAIYLFTWMDIESSSTLLFEEEAQGKLKATLNGIWRPHLIVHAIATKLGWRKTFTQRVCADIRHVFFINCMRDCDSEVLKSIFIYISWTVIIQLQILFISQMQQYYFFLSKSEVFFDAAFQQIAILHTGFTGMHFF